jgi:hypothetical protein
MIKVELNGKEYDIPHKWEEVKFSKFLEFYNLTKSFKTKEELEEVYEDKDDIKDLYVTLDTLKSNTKMVSFWTGISEDEVGMCDLDEVAQCLKDLAFLSKQYKPIHIDDFTFNGEKYFLPNRDYSKLSFGDYVQAEQLELNAKKLEQGRIEVMPEQVAILCKKEGETQLSDEEIDKRANMFKELDMATVWDVGFFLTQRESLLMTSFLISQKERLTTLQKSQQKEQ